MDEDNIKEAVSKVEGFLSDDEGLLLYRLAKTLNEANIVEIGSWKGRSTIWLGKAAKKSNSHVYAIDPHTGSPEHRTMFGRVDTYDQFLKNVGAGLSDVVIPIRKRSDEAIRSWSNPVHLLWIDGAHDYDSVLSDFKLWDQYLVNGGVIAFHDSRSEGVKRILSDILFKSTSFNCIDIIGTIVVFKKLEKLTFNDTIKNKIFLKTFYLKEALYYIKEGCKSVWKNH